MIGGKVLGLASFLHQIHSNEKKLQKAAQARAMEEAEHIAEKMREAVPAQSGAARESIQVEPTKTGAAVVIGGEGTTKDGYDYVRALEWGRPPSATGPGQRGTRVFTRTYDGEKQGAGDRIAAGVAEDMKE